MGNTCCEDGTREPKDNIGDITLEQPLDKKREVSDEYRISQYSNYRTEVKLLPITNNKVEDNIRKLSKLSGTNGKIWKLKHPFNLIYTNKDLMFEDQLPRGYVKAYRVKENGDFLGYFEGIVDQQFQPDLRDAFFVYHNGSYLVGTGNNQGIYTNQTTNLRYEGGWVDQQPQGNGKEQNNRGNYEGSYLQGEKHGQGKFVWYNGSSYQGNFQRGAFSGQGIFKDPNNHYSYSGDYCQDLKHGVGIEQKNRQTYKGHYFKGTRCGYGKLIVYEDQDKNIPKYKFQGTFFENSPHGKGIYSEGGSTKSVEGMWDRGVLVSVTAE